MTAAQFAALAAEIHGRFGWAQAVAKDHNVHRSTALRWGSGEIEIPPEAIERLRQKARAKVTMLWDLAR